MDGFFDMPAGYSDADLEMGALEDLGNRYRRRYRGYSPTDVETLRNGGTIVTARIAKETGERYMVEVRTLDIDEIGPCDFRYSIDGRTWHETAKAARLAETPCQH